MMVYALIDQSDLIIVQKQIGSRNNFRFAQHLYCALRRNIKGTDTVDFRIKKLNPHRSVAVDRIDVDNSAAAGKAQRLIHPCSLLVARRDQGALQIVHRHFHTGF